MILNEQQRRELAKNFPGRCVSRYWLLGNAIFIEDPDVLTDTYQSSLLSIMDIL